MKKILLAENIIYLLVILLSLVIVTLLAISPATLLSASPIYKGF